MGLTPDFLRSLVAPAHFMRLSLKESRIRGRVQCSVQEIRAAPSFSAQVRRGEPGAPVLFLDYIEWMESQKERAVESHSRRFVRGKGFKSWQKHWRAMVSRANEK